jgi:hypothetical protein
MIEDEASFLKAMLKSRREPGFRIARDFPSIAKERILQQAIYCPNIQPLLIFKQMAGKLFFSTHRWMDNLACIEIRLDEGNLVFGAFYYKLNDNEFQTAQQEVNNVAKEVYHKLTGGVAYTTERIHIDTPLPFAGKKPKKIDATIPVRGDGFRKKPVFMKKCASLRKEPVVNLKSEPQVTVSSKVQDAAKLLPLELDVCCAGDPELTNLLIEPSKSCPKSDPSESIPKNMENSKRIEFVVKTYESSVESHAAESSHDSLDSPFTKGDELIEQHPILKDLDLACDSDIDISLFTSLRPLQIGAEVRDANGSELFTVLTNQDSFRSIAAPTSILMSLEEFEALACQCDDVFNDEPTIAKSENLSEFYGRIFDLTAEEFSKLLLSFSERLQNLSMPL